MITKSEVATMPSRTPAEEERDGNWYPVQTLQLLYILAPQSEIWGPAASASPEGSLEMQNLAESASAF